MEDYYIKEIFDNYYNKILNFKLELPKIIIEDKKKYKNKTITKIRINSNMEKFNFVLIEMKNKAIVMETCGFSKKIYKFKNKKINNLSNFGVLIVDLRNKRTIETCDFNEGQLHKWEGFAVTKRFDSQYWINGKRYKDLSAVNKLKIQNKVESF